MSLGGGGGGGMVNDEVDSRINSLGSSIIDKVILNQFNRQLSSIIELRRNDLHTDVSKN